MGEPNAMKVRGAGVDIQVAEWPGHGSPIVLIHGLTANCRCFDVLAEALSPQYRVLAVDLRGRGLSDKPDTGYSIERHSDDIIAVMENLGLERAAVMGHSLGAYIATAVVAKRPDLTEKLVLLDGGAPLDQDQWEKVSEGIKPSLERLKASFPSFEAYVAPLKAFPALQPWNEALETYFRYDSHEVDGMVRSRINPDHIEEEAANLVSADIQGRLGAIRCPVLIVRATKGIFSDDDLVVPETGLEALLKALPQARVVTLEQDNHYSLIFRSPERRDRAILDFLAEDA